MDPTCDGYPDEVFPLMDLAEFKNWINAITVSSELGEATVIRGEILCRRIAVFAAICRSVSRPNWPPRYLTQIKQDGQELKEIERVANRSVYSHRKI